MMILLFNIVNVSEIDCRTEINKLRQDLSDRNNSEESEEKSGNRTTLTFGQMVGIYHDIWNAMLMGGGGGEEGGEKCISSILK